ncbi:MAG: SRPBCC family protein [Chloroflexota bacterium]
MPEIRVTASGMVQAPADLVYRCLADYREHHPNILPSVFSNLEVVAGGYGAGTVFRFQMSIAGRIRHAQMTVTEPEPGRVLEEKDVASGLVTRFVVTPLVDDGATRVTIDTRWQSSSGVGGLAERLFAPLLLKRPYRDELIRLDAYARGLSQGS